MPFVYTFVYAKGQAGKLFVGQKYFECVIHLSSPAQQYATDVVVYTALFIISLAFSFQHKIPNDGGRADFMLPQ